MNKAWIYVGLTCLFELIWVYGFNEAQTWWQWAIVVGVIFLDYHILPKACETLPTGTVYAVFAGIGTIGTVLMDIYLFGESFSFGKAFFIMMIVLGVIGLNLWDKEEADEKDAMKGAA
ncbi:DMT family transporter [Neobacillus drentensis]|uniref:DMT family transporter n=1 Tax=Neobacillus drentensis TaxID=220684 RepID=UPI002FFFF505